MICPVEIASEVSALRAARWPGYLTNGPSKLGNGAGAWAARQARWRIAGLFTSQLVNRSHILDQQRVTLNCGDLLPARIGESTSYSFAGPASDLHDLLLSQSRSEE